MKTTLENLIELKNIAELQVKEAYPLFEDYLKQFIGEKIVKANNDFIKKVNENIPKLETSKVYVGFSIDENFVWLDYAHEETDCELLRRPLAKLKKGKLIRVIPIQEQNFALNTYKDIVFKRKLVKQLKEKVQKLESILEPFNGC